MQYALATARALGDGYNLSGWTLPSWKSLPLRDVDAELARASDLGKLDFVITTHSMLVCFRKDAHRGHANAIISVGALEGFSRFVQWAKESREHP